MKLSICGLFATIAMASAPAWAINKCTIDGRVVFQDAACPGKGETLSVRPASGSAPSTQPSEATGAGAKSDGSAKPQTEAQRIEKQIAESQQERRKQELEVRLVPDSLAAIRRQRAACDREIKDLRVQKSRANNNLAGATWEGAISGEMTALATRCDTRNRELREDAAALRAECQQLGGCKR